MVKSHAESQRNPVELWLSTLILGGLAHWGLVVPGESDGSAMAGLRGVGLQEQVGIFGRGLAVRWVTMGRDTGSFDGAKTGGDLSGWVCSSY